MRSPHPPSTPAQPSVAVSSAYPSRDRPAVDRSNPRHDVIRYSVPSQTRSGTTRVTAIQSHRAAFTEDDATMQASPPGPSARTETASQIADPSAAQPTLREVSSSHPLQQQRQGLAGASPAAAASNPEAWRIEDPDFVAQVQQLFGSVLHAPAVRRCMHALQAHSSQQQQQQQQQQRTSSNQAAPSWPVDNPAFTLDVCRVFGSQSCIPRMQQAIAKLERRLARLPQQQQRSREIQASIMTDLLADRPTSHVQARQQTQDFDEDEDDPDAWRQEDPDFLAEVIETFGSPVHAASARRAAANMNAHEAERLCQQQLQPEEPQPVLLDAEGQAIDESYSRPFRGPTAFTVPGRTMAQLTCMYRAHNAQLGGLCFGVTHGNISVDMAVWAVMHGTQQLSAWLRAEREQVTPLQSLAHAEDRSMHVDAVAADAARLRLDPTNPFMRQAQRYMQLIQNAGDSLAQRQAQPAAEMDWGSDEDGADFDAGSGQLLKT